MKLATPLPLTAPVPKMAVPSLKVTLPVGELPVTVAVRTVVCPMLLGLTLEVR
jgi:hypothetical protein